MSLDKNNTNIGYLLGRLFAVFEVEARGGDPFGEIEKTGMGGSQPKLYEDFETSPSKTLPRLMAIYQKKVKKHHEPLIESIINKIPASLPSGLSQEQRAAYGVGYYHQKNAIARYISGRKEAVDA